MSADPQSPSPVQRITANPALLALAIVAIVALLAACGMGFFLLRDYLDRDDAVTTTTGEPTPFPQVAEVVGETQPLIVGVSDSGTYSVTLDIPAVLSLRDQQRSVEPQNIGADGLWNPDIDDPNATAWVNGTIINYVFGLPDTPANESLIESLAPGDQITVNTRQGTTHTFTFDSQAQVPNTDRSIFNQQTPGITLVLLGGEGSDRLVARGRYEVAAAGSESSGNVIQMGETAQLGDVQITPEATSFLTGRPEVPPGFGIFLVDFRLQNVGLTAIDTSNYQFVLSDELGNQYALNPIASQLGNHPPLSGFVNAGQVLNATAGYQIPAGLVSPNLTWTVTAPDGAQIQAIFPFTAGGDVGQSAVVSLQSASITADLNNLVIVGQITNVGVQPLVVTAEDITLLTPGGSAYILLATNPTFPWTVPPNQTLQFAVTYQRPIGADSAVFTVLNQSFDLSGFQ
ncbi:MAG: hypothetical protein R6X18_16270 [Chloroflexota bacterium]|jgi:hypothetical protein